jgi:predicted transcriptional regulator
MPERVHVQLLEMPDGARFLSMAKAVARPLPGGGSALQAVAVGCDAAEADRLVYDPGKAAEPTPAGIACRLCEREDCAERAFPPMQRALKLDPHVRGAAPFTFSRD